VAETIKALDANTDPSQVGQADIDYLIFRAAIEDGGRLDLETINGDIDLDFAGNISGRFDIETFNGSIDNCFGPEPQRTSQYTPGRELKFSEGDSNTRIVIRTLNGGLRMCRD